MPLSRSVQIASVAVPFDGYASYSFGVGQGAPADIRLVIHLDTLAQRLTAILRKTGVERDEQCGDKVAIRDTQFAEQDGMLFAKVFGHVGRQECSKADVPEFHGFEVRMKTRIVASATLESDASLEFLFRPKLQDGVLRMERISTRANISNDLVRALVGLFDDGRLKDSVSAAVDQALADPRNMLELPTELAGLEVTFDRARIAVDECRVSLELDGSSAPLPPLRSVLLDYLSDLAGSTAAVAAPCR